jgi:membrane peptidoglycan carboxypeptidase
VPNDPNNEMDLPPEDDNLDGPTIPYNRENDKVDQDGPTVPYSQDDDVPFRLPMAQDDDYAGPDDDTGDMPSVTASSEGILNRPGDMNPHNMPTMPIPREPGMPDPQRTATNSPGLGQTVQHRAPRPEDMSYTQPAQRQQPKPRPEDMRYTQPPAAQQPPPATVPRPTPTVQNLRYQNPQNYPQPPAQQGARNVPPPQQPQRRSNGPQNGGTQNSRANGNRRRGNGRLIGCMPNGCLLIGGGIFVTFCGGLTLLFLIGLGVANARIGPVIEQGMATIDQYEAFESTFYYDRDGDLLYEDFNEGRRDFVPLDQMPENLINATIALEDDTFYTNPGIEVAATIRATLQFVDIIPGDTGGSTITQQLVRNIAFDYEKRTARSVARKAEEILLALAITGRLSKDEVLELYLNEIYYGNLAYGAQAAATTIFGKDVGELTLGEAALLAGLPQAPASLDPLNPDPEVQQAVLTRWRQVLDSMVREGYITQQVRNQTLQAGLNVFTPEAPLNAPHFTVYAQEELTDLMTGLGYEPADVARGGYRVYTTVDLQLHNQVERSIQSQLSRLTANNVTNGAVVVLKPLTGEIITMVGSADYENDVIDGRVNVATALRQPGSSIKPFTYAAAMENGFSPAEPIWDTRMRSVPVPGLSTWPVNYDGSYHGPVNMRTGLANSYNVSAVQVFQKAVGVPYFLEFANRLGIESLGTDASLYGPSITLGGGEVPLLELANGYGVFANQGALVPTTSILCVVDSDDRVIYQYEGACPEGNITGETVARTGLGKQVLDPRIAYIISDILADNSARAPAMGVNSPLRTDGIRSSSKTGTTNDIKDNWTVGYTRNVVVGVWVGNSNGDPMVNSSGLTGAAPIWNEVITSIYNTPRYFNMLAVDGTHQQDQPNPPQGMSLRQVCNVRALSEGSTSCPTISEWLLDGPAGIPDENGELVFRQQQGNREAAPVAGQPFQQEVSPGVIRVLASPIPQSIAAGLILQAGPGIPAPPSPRYCQVPSGLAGSAPAAQDLLFLAPPPAPADAVEAEQYAVNNGLAYLPTIACNQELLNAQPAGGAIVLTAIITSPSPGQVITEGIPVLGTVQFSPEQAEYFKLEIRGGQFPDWTTIGSTHRNSVVNGQLEFLPGYPGLQPGSYEVRLAVVGNGNYVQEPYTVPFTVAAS